MGQNKEDNLIFFFHKLNFTIFFTKSFFFNRPLDDNQVLQLDAFTIRI